MNSALSEAKFNRDVAALTDAAASRLDLDVHSRAYPVLDVTIRHTKSLRLRFQADSWDELPPSVTLLKPDGSPWTDPLPGGVFNDSNHPTTGRKFICMRGVREFHTHSSHTNEKWEGFRGQDGMGLVGLLMQIRNAWKAANK